MNAFSRVFFAERSAMSGRAFFVDKFRSKSGRNSAVRFRPAFLAGTCNNVAADFAATGTNITSRLPICCRRIRQLGVCLRTDFLGAGNFFGRHHCGEFVAIHQRFLMAAGCSNVEPEVGGLLVRR